MTLQIQNFSGEGSSSRVRLRAASLGADGSAYPPIFRVKDAPPSRNSAVNAVAQPGPEAWVIFSVG